VSDASLSDMDARMAQLRERFRTRAADDRERIAAALDAGDLREIHRLAHALSGSAGVFGFPQVSEDAAAVENAIDEARPAGEIGALCAQLLRRLAAVAQRA
jgi:HPt (histidine-containing phosphotransfer) domain-containing protein